MPWPAGICHATFCHAGTIGYKMAKFLTRIEVTDRFDHIGQGHGGTWEDDGYEWYAGI